MNTTSLMEKKEEKREERAESLLKNCRELLRKEGIPASENIVGLKINDRIRSRFGSCRKVNTRNQRSGEYLIEISGKILEGEDQTVETVLLHELLHTCYGCMNHGKRWKRYAMQLNQKYGYEIKPSAGYEAFGLEDPGSREKIRYRIVCMNCGMEMTRKRRCPLVVNTDRYRCGKCGGKLEIR
ncbi:MAG: SprT-like domain-containing protein [Anaerovoracaceae bacterium]